MSDSGRRGGFDYNRLRGIGRSVRFALHKLAAPKNAILIDIVFGGR
jgi:hypothetical protein